MVSVRNTIPTKISYSCNLACGLEARDAVAAHVSRRLLSFALKNIVTLA